ncbi:ABC transporter ATP-binding protein [Rhodohalobacter sulfatireducens]|uniref:ABC transporter ATP-binding protein n=1 Tax=Rhodohalobacter sulfatireducens TaxID=2911366 RepID=A0ABS9KGQ8_9BACT|nr:ABC transporter ATP-binding protein [Rhodohalobacter sulfatireducens]MCG2590023.1 ABC transporter ATP-binding protein [Rhodohalobacter sulfatireducens]
MSDDFVLQCSDIHKEFPSESGNGVLRILQGVDLQVKKAEIISIVGSSGSGKSTLLHILGGLDHPTSGDVFWEGKSIYRYNKDQLAEQRNKQVGFVFQFHHLLPEFTAMENVMMPALIQDVPLPNAENRAKELLDRFGMSGRLNHRPSQLSGGEQQRVSMARALTNNPAIILADEPTGNLDEKNTESILSLLFQLRDMEEVSIVLITHEKDIATRCDIVYSLHNGTLNGI